MLALAFLYGSAIATQTARERRSVICGQKVMLTHMQGAKLQSPMYPMFFEDQNQCMWEIRSFDPQSRIKIFFDDWMMPLSPSGGCESSYLEIRELVDSNVQSSVKLCGTNPEVYISNLDHLTISLQGDTLGGAVKLGPKRFSLRAELTTEPPRTMATDGSFVVNGMTPMAAFPMNYSPPQYSQPIQHSRPYPAQTHQPHPQTHQQQHHHHHHHHQEHQQQPQPPLYPPMYPEQASVGLKNSANNYQVQNPYPQNPYPYGAAEPAGSTYNQQGMYNTYQNPYAAPNPYERVESYPTYGDYGEEEEEAAEMDATTKVTITLLLIALIAAAIVVMAYVYKRRNNGPKSAERPADSSDTRRRVAAHNVRQFKLKLRENAADFGEKVRVNSVRANHKLREKVTQIKSKVASRPDSQCNV